MRYGPFSSDSPLRPASVSAVPPLPFGCPDGIRHCWRGSIGRSADRWLSSPGRVGLRPRGFCTMKTYVATPADRQRDWYVVDAEGKTLGRLATQIADALRGKRKPEYTPARRHRRLHRRRQRGEDPRHRRQAGAEDLLAPQRLPGRDQVADAGRDARAPPRGGDPQGGQGHAAAQPPRPPAADQAEGVRRAGSSARGPAAQTDGDETDGRRRDRRDATTRRPRARTTRPRVLSRRRPVVLASCGRGADRRRRPADEAPEEPAAEAPEAEAEPLPRRPSEEPVPRRPPAEEAPLRSP